MGTELRPNLSHWGAFDAEVEDDRLVAIHPAPSDPDPSPILRNLASAVHHRTRVQEPMVRAGWLDRGPGPSERRGAEPFVAVSWERAIDLLAEELRRVYDTHGPTAVYGGSGWGSAGRFHQAGGQLRRFLNCLGGHTYPVNTYSRGASEVILPHVLGAETEVVQRAPSWPVVVEHTRLLVCFGGLPVKGTAVSHGGISQHRTREHLAEAARRGLRLVLFSPVRDDLPGFADVTWHPLVPGTDVAVMLALAHTLIVERLLDREFLDRYCVGFDRFERYVLGQDDARPKSPEWAEGIADVPAEAIRQLAREMAASRTLISVTWSLQRADHGEQVPWMGVTLAAMLGQLGLPGGGLAHGYGSTASPGAEPLPYGLPTLPPVKNPVRSFIPVARISDLLLRPGEEFDYNGHRLTFPDIRLVYWCGGNPFHHHQHLGRLRRALARPDTIVVHDAFWTSMARSADIVLPATLTLERNDIGASNNDTSLTAMHKAIEPYGAARNDFDTFAALAGELGVGPSFTEGRSEMEWIEHLYESWRAIADQRGFSFPDFAAFWAAGRVALPRGTGPRFGFEAFRRDPDACRLPTPSGRIEIFSETIDGFGYADCPGHPTWLEPAEWLGAPLASRFPLHLIADNPASRLHSQMDVGAYSQDSKVQGREPIRIHPTDARARGIANGDVVRVFNDRGSCLAGAVVSEAVREGVVQLSTGAWYDPIDPIDVDSMCVHGNPNVLTRDVGTSRLAQGCAGQHALVQVERWNEPLPPIKVLDPPVIERRDGPRARA